MHTAADTLGAGVRRQLLGARRTAVILVLVLGACGATGGLFWGLREARVHVAVAVILVNPLEGNPFGPDDRGDDLVNLQTESQLVLSDAVAVRVAEREGGDRSREQTLQGMSVSVPTNTQLLQITSSASSAGAAQLRAQDFALVYLAFRRSRTEAVIDSRRAELARQIAGQDAKRRELLHQLDETTAASPRARLLTQQVLSVAALVSDLDAQLSSLASSSLNPGMVVTPAAVAGHGLPGGVGGSTGLGLVLGGALGFVVASGLARRADPIHDARELAAAGPPVLGSLPGTGTGVQVAAARLRSSLLAGGPRPVLALVAAAGVRAAGATRVREALARSAVAAGLSVIDLDLTARAHVGESSRIGLSDLLDGRVALEEALEVIDLHLSRIGPGTEPDRLVDLVASPRLGPLLDQLRRHGDVVLLGAGTISEPLTSSLATAVGRVVLAVEIEQTPFRDLEADLAGLNARGVTDVATVALTGSPRRSWREDPHVIGVVSRLRVGLAVGVAATPDRIRGRS